MKASRGMGLERPRERFCSSHLKVSRPGLSTGAPLWSVPLGHRDIHTGPGSVAPGWGRRLPTRGQIVEKRNNKIKVMATTAIILNTPPRGSTQLSYLTQEAKGKGKGEPGAARPASVYGGD